MDTNRFCPKCGKELNENGFCDDTECNVSFVKGAINYISTKRYIKLNKTLDIAFKESPVFKRLKLETERRFKQKAW